MQAGCWSAIDLALLAGGVPGVTAIDLDLSVAAVQAARTFAAHLGVAVRLCVGDAFALPLPTGGLGLVFSQEVPEQSCDPAAAVQAQVRVLAPRGC